MKDDSGFTLLEVLIALQIVLVCMLFVFPCVHAMKVLSEDSRQTDDAMALYFFEENWRQPAVYIFLHLHWTMRLSKK